MAGPTAHGYGRHGQAYILLAAASAARITAASAGVPFSFSNSPYGVP